MKISMFPNILEFKLVFKNTNRFEIMQLNYIPYVFLEDSWLGISYISSSEKNLLLDQS